MSDERFVALADVLLEFQRDGQTVTIVRSTPRGAVHAGVPAGEYMSRLVKPGLGSKTVRMNAHPSEPFHFRMLSDCILGYVWPREVKAGQRSEFRVHSPESYRLIIIRFQVETNYPRPSRQISQTLTVTG